MKKLLSAFVILAAVSLITGPAFATTGLGVLGAPFTVAAELVGCQGYTLSPMFDVYSTPGQGTIIPSTKLTLTLSGGAVFNTTATIYLCDSSSATDYAIAYPGATGYNATATVATFPTTAPISGFNTAYSFQNAPCAVAATSGGYPGQGLLTSITLPAGTPAGTSVTMCVSTSSPSTYDPNIYSCAPGPIIVVKNQFTATLNGNIGGGPDNTFIDFASNETTFIPTVPKPPIPPYDTKDCAYAALLITSDETISQRVSVYYPTGSPPASTSLCGGYLVETSTITGQPYNLVITATGNLTGLDELDYGIVTTSITPPTKGITSWSQGLIVPGEVVDICSAAAPGLTTNLAQEYLSLCDNWPRSGQPPTWPLGTEIVPGCETVSVQLWYSECPTSAGPTPGLIRTLLPATNAWCLNNNATSFYIPYMSTNPAVVTSCTVNNFSLASSLASPTNTGGWAGVTLDILSSESETGITTASIPLGSLSPNQTALIVFSGNSVEMFGPGGLTQTIGVPATTRYSSRVNVEATALGTDFECVQTDPSNPSGYKRNVQVTTNPNFGWRAPAPLQ